MIIAVTDLMIISGNTDRDMAEVTVVMNNATSEYVTEIAEEDMK